MALDIAWMRGVAERSDARGGYTRILPHELTTLLDAYEQARAWEQAANDANTALRECRAQRDAEREAADVMAAMADGLECSILWHTTCECTAKMFDQMYAETMRAERAEAVVAALREGLEALPDRAGWCGQRGTCGRCSQCVTDRIKALLASPNPGAALASSSPQ